MTSRTTETGYVLVLNHFAAPRGAPGGTRHTELLSRLNCWTGRIIAGDRNLFTRQKVTLDNAFEPVWVLPYGGNGVARVVNWISFAVTSFAAGLRGPRPDVVYASSPHLFAAVAGLALARLRRVPLVVEVRDLWPRVLVDMGAMSEASLFYRLLALLERWLYRGADAVVVLAPGSVEAIRLAEPRVRRIELIPNGADPADFVTDVPKEELRSLYGIEPPAFVYAGAHGPANGLDLLLDAADEVRREGTNANVLFVGDGVEKQRLVNRAAAQGATNVRFLDPLPKTEMPALLGASDVGVHVLADVPLFRFGVSPNKLYDYMAAGLPVITNTPGEVSDIVERAGAGIAVEPRALAHGIRRMATATAQERAQWGANGRRWIEENQSRTAMAARVEALLDDVSGRRTS